MYYVNCDFHASVASFFYSYSWWLFEANKRSIFFYCWKDVIQPANGLFGHGRACMSIYYSAITRQLVLTTLIIGRDGNILSARNENCWSVRFSSQDIKDRSGIFCDLIGLFGVHFIYGSSMPLSFTLSYNKTLIPLPWVFLWQWKPFLDEPPFVFAKTMKLLAQLISRQHCCLTFWK